MKKIPGEGSRRVAAPLKSIDQVCYTLKFVKLTRGHCTHCTAVKRGADEKSRV